MFWSGKLRAGRLFSDAGYREVWSVIKRRQAMIHLIGCAAIISLIILVGGPGIASASPRTDRRRRSTGIVGLNLLLDGGFPEGTIIMVHGTAVTGVDLAARHFCNANPDETGMYFNADDIIEQDCSQMNPALLLEQMNGTRVAVDSFTTIINRYGIEQALFLLGHLKETIRSKNANLMFVVYSGVHTPMDMTRIMRTADVVIEFKTEVSQSEIQRTLAVQKIRGAAVPQRLLPFIITNNGIEAATTSRVV
jgi:KaiC/GvpD/RAD55 family RecA-like ATPase